MHLTDHGIPRAAMPQNFNDLRCTQPFRMHPLNLKASGLPAPRTVRLNCAVAAFFANPTLPKRPRLRTPRRAAGGPERDGRDTVAQVIPHHQ
jgi:hypothetical protein